MKRIVTAIAVSLAGVLEYSRTLPGWFLLAAVVSIAAGATLALYRCTPAGGGR